MKKHIDTYSTVYGVDIVIANKAVTLKDLQKLYTYSDNVELDQDIMTDIASTSTCRNRKTNRYCILVKFNSNSIIKGQDKKLFLINTVSHEALHVAMDLYSFSGDKVNPRDSNEHLAYLVGWITEIIYKTFTKK